MTIANGSFGRSPGGVFVANDARNARESGDVGGALEYIGTVGSGSGNPIVCACASAPCATSGSVSGTNARFAWFDDPASATAEGLTPAGRLASGTNWTGATSNESFVIGNLNCVRRYFFDVSFPADGWYFEDYFVSGHPDADILIRDRKLNFLGPGRHQDVFTLVDRQSVGSQGLGYGPVGETITTDPPDPEGAFEVYLNQPGTFELCSTTSPFDANGIFRVEVSTTSGTTITRSALEGGTWLWTEDVSQSSWTTFPQQLCPDPLPQTYPRVVTGQNLVGHMWVGGNLPVGPLWGFWGATPFSVGATGTIRRLS